MYMWIAHMYECIYICICVYYVSICYQIIRGLVRKSRSRTVQDTFKIVRVICTIWSLSIKSAPKTPPGSDEPLSHLTWLTVNFKKCTWNWIVHISLCVWLQHHRLRARAEREKRGTERARSERRRKEEDRSKWNGPADWTSCIMHPSYRSSCIMHRVDHHPSSGSPMTMYHASSGSSCIIHHPSSGASCIIHHLEHHASSIIWSIMHHVLKEKRKLGRCVIGRGVGLRT